MVLGGHFSILIRPIERSGDGEQKYEIEGICYIHGIMDEQAFTSCSEKQGIALV